MKKLRLEIEALHVQSFATAARQERRGTVRGHDGILVGGGDFEYVIGNEPVIGVERTEGSCGAPDCKTEPVLCPP